MSKCLSSIKRSLSGFWLVTGPRTMPRGSWCTETLSCMSGRSMRPLVVNWPRSSRPCSVRTMDKINEVRASIKEEPATSICKLAREHNMSVMSMSDLLRKDLKLKSLVKQKVQMLMPLQMQKHVFPGWKIRNFLKSRLQGRVVVYTDEKDFAVDAHLNKRNNWYISTSVKDAAPELRFVGARKHPSKASMLGIIMSNSKALPPFWYEGSMDRAKYKNYLQRKVLPMLDTTYGKERYVFTQNGVPGEVPRVQGVLVKGDVASLIPPTWTPWTSVSGCMLRRGPVLSPYCLWPSSSPRWRQCGTPCPRTTSGTAALSSDAASRPASLPMVECLRNEMKVRLNAAYSN